MRDSPLIHAIEWKGDNVRFIDQTRLPNKEIYVETRDPMVIADGIRHLAIRGAPLIGIAASYAVVLAANQLAHNSVEEIRRSLDKVINLLAATRPTAVNLFWALDRQRRLIESFSDGSLTLLRRTLLEQAIKMHHEDRERCKRIGELGAELLPKAAKVLTHCNTGSLATGGMGTAQGIISTAWQRHTLRHVYVDETRPLLQGARLTMWELGKLGIPATLITDSAAAFLMQRGEVNAVIVGADRITLNGDTANKVGTYNLAVLAHFHSVPFYVAAPTSSIDFRMTSGKEIPIEQRAAKEITEIAGFKTAPDNVEVYSPAFDITPNQLIAAIITERGVVTAPFHQVFESLRIKINDSTFAGVER